MTDQSEDMSIGQDKQTFEPSHVISNNVVFWHV